MGFARRKSVKLGSVLIPLAIAAPAMIDTLKLIKVEHEILRDTAKLRKNMKTYNQMQKKVKEAGNNLKMVQEKLKRR